jgi:hypothetical protein
MRQMGLFTEGVCKHANNQIVRRLVHCSCHSCVVAKHNFDWKKLVSSVCLCRCKL